MRTIKVGHATLVTVPGVDNVERMRMGNEMKSRLLVMAGLIALALPASARLMDGMPGMDMGLESVIPAPAPPGDFEQWQRRAAQGDAFAQWVVANQFFRAGPNYRQEALSALKQSAENHYSQAELDWGRILLHGLLETTIDAPNGMRWIERAEQSGNAEAAYVLAVATWNGWSGGVDRKKSVYWLKRAAEKGWSRAREVLGLMLRDGIEITQDPREAARWLELAAVQGRPDAKFALAAMFSVGQGVEQDDARALQLYRELAKAGYLPAEQKVASMVAEGRGEATDPAPLKAFLEKSAQAGYANFAYELGNGLIEGRFGQPDRAAGMHWLEQAAGIDHPLAQYQLAWQGRAAALRVQWLERAARLGYTPAQFYLGMAYAYGDGVEADDKAAIDWYRRAAEKGYVQAQSSLAWRYFQGVTLPHDEALGITWSRKAADQGDELSMKNLIARLLARGEAATYDEALVWMKRLADAGHSQYQNYLGAVYSGQFPGYGARYKNYAEALRWWRKAAAQGNAAAEINVGNAYAQGWGVPVDVWQAIPWYERGAGHGDVAGDINLARIYQTGRGMLHDPEKARQHLARATQGGSALARQQAAQVENPAYRWMNSQGQIEWPRVKDEAKDGNLEAQKILATAYLYGNLGMPQSVPNAHHWFLRAAEQGDADAMNNVGFTLYRGFLGKTDLEGAAIWFEKSARAGNTKAMISLARMHEQGENGRPAAKKALNWLVKAAEAHDQQAIQRLIVVYRNGELDQKADPRRAAYWEARIGKPLLKDAP